MFGYGPYLIAIAAELPKPHLTAELIAVLSEIWRCWAVNVREKSHPVTEYGNFHFNSMGLFNDKVIAAGPDGLFLLDESNVDAGANIDAKVATGELDYDQSFLFRLPRIYVGYQAEKAMEFHTIVTSDGMRVYSLPASTNPGVQQRRVPVGRGPKSRYWQLEMLNKDGGDFSLASMIVYPEATQRRVK